MAPELITANIRGLKTAWISQGSPEKPILLLLHGYPDTPESWNLQINHFKEKFQIIAPYARGARPSEKGDSLRRYSLDAVCLDMLQILQEVDPAQKRPVSIVGHDMGGVIAWRLSVLLGERLRALVIINSLAIEQMTRRLLTKTGQQKKSWYIYAFATPYFRNKWIKKNPAKLLLKAHEKGQLPPSLRPPLAKSISGVVGPVMHYRAFLSDAFKSLYKKPHRLTKPVLVLWSSLDPFLEMIHADEMQLVSANHTIRVLEGNHWIHREQSGIVNELMEEFLCN